MKPITTRAGSVRKQFGMLVNKTMMGKFMRLVILVAITGLTATVSSADEAFVSIQRVSGNQIAVVMDEGGRGRRGGRVEGGDAIPQRGRRRAMANQQPLILTVPADAKITTAMRERRTFEFRVGGELGGGLRHRIFTEMRQPLSARIVSEGNRITEINVITPQIDINQSQTDSSGRSVIAVRPKRPPVKRK